jgi:hypothetical protein
MEVVPCIEYDSIFQVGILLQQSRQCLSRTLRRHDGVITEDVTL